MKRTVNRIMVEIGNNWDNLLSDQWQQPYYKDLRNFLKAEYNNHTVYPPKDDIFNALKLTPYENVKVVILGQDPYHGVGQAHGLAFSVQYGIPAPPSLVNIFKEIPIVNRPSGNLTNWAEQGVLLLNTVLTVRTGCPNSHKGKGWEILTDRIIALLNQREQPIVFMLWGNNAKAKAGLIDETKHLVLKAAHPSPLSAYNGFFGCRHFDKANDFLRMCGQSEIDWS
jgi:uracil-DNA glycosylase